MAAGSVILEFLAKTGSFETDTARAAKSLKTIAKEAEAASRAFKASFAGNLAAGFARDIIQGIGSIPGRLVDLVKGSIDSADHLNDLSKKTGVAVETLGGLGFAASQAGGDLESTAAGLGKLNKTIAEAAAGNKDAVEFFKVLGISVKDSSGNIKDAGAIYLEVADKFAKFEDGPNKAALALRGFGKAGLDQIPILNEGAAALQANIDYFKQYSGVTKETAKAADEFNDTQTKLKLLTGAFGNVLAAEALPLLQTLADRFLEAKEKGDGFRTGAEGIVSILKGLAIAAAYVGDTFGGVGREIAALAAQGTILREAFSGASLLEKASPILMAKRLSEAFNSAQFTGISDAVKEDGERAKKALDDLVAKILNPAAKLDLSGFAKTASSFGSSGKTSAPGLAGDAGPKKTDPFDALIKSAREMDAVAKASLESEDDLTEARKLAIKIATDLAAGTLKLSDARVSEIDEILKSADATQKAIELKKREADATVSAISARESFLQQQIGIVTSLREEAEAAQLQAKQFGLSTEAIVQQAIAKERLKAAAKDLLAIQVGDREGNEALADTYREQAKAIRDAAKAREELLQAQIKLDTDPLTGASQAVKDYLDVVSKAGKATYDVTREAITGIEQIGVDALQGKNIKAQAKSLVTQLIAEFYRLQIIRPLLKSIMGEGGGLTGLLSLFGGGAGNLQLGGAGGTTITPQLVGEFVNGSPYIPRTGLAKVHQGERVLTRKENTEGGWGGSKVEILNYGNDRVREDPVRGGDKKLVRLIIGEVSRDSRRGGETRQATREAVGPRPRRG